MGGKSKDEVNSSARRAIYEERQHNCKNVGFEESHTQKIRIGNA